MSAEPLPPDDPSSLSPLGTTAPGSGLPSATAAGLAALFPFFGGVIFYYLDRKDSFVRFYAVQSIVLGAILSVVSATIGLGINMFGPIWLIGWIFVWAFTIFRLVFFLVWAAVWVIVTICAFRGKRWPLPFLSGLLKRYTTLPNGADR